MRWHSRYLRRDVITSGCCCHANGFNELLHGCERVHWAHLIQLIGERFSSAALSILMWSAASERGQWQLLHGSQPRMWDMESCVLRGEITQNVCLPVNSRNIRACRDTWMCVNEKSIGFQWDLVTAHAAPLQIYLADFLLFGRGVTTKISSCWCNAWWNDTEAWNTSTKELLTFRPYLKTNQVISLQILITWKT